MLVSLRRWYHTSPRLLISSAPCAATCLYLPLPLSRVLTAGRGSRRACLYSLHLPEASPHVACNPRRNEGR